MIGLSSLGLDKNLKLSSSSSLSTGLNFLLNLLDVKMIKLLFIRGSDLRESSEAFDFDLGDIVDFCSFLTAKVSSEEVVLTQTKAGVGIRLLHKVW